ncbi:hypothetical protein MTO96_011851 [Rhipicephalus appendiculatus]
MTSRAAQSLLESSLRQRSEQRRSDPRSERGGVPLHPSGSCRSFRVHPLPSVARAAGGRRWSGFRVRPLLNQARKGKQGSDSDWAWLLRKLPESADPFAAPA